MAGYEHWLSGAGGGEFGDGEIRSLVSEILAGAGLEGVAKAPQGDTLLRSVLGGVGSALPTGYATPQAGAVTGGMGAGGIASLLHALEAPAQVPAASSSLRNAMGIGEGIALPMRGVAGLLGGLLNLFQGDAAAPATAATYAMPFKFPVARNASFATGPNGQGSYELDYRFDGQPRRTNQGGALESRVEIHIQALDARSILDRKEEIAEAVRQAVSSSGIGRESLLGY